VLFSKMSKLLQNCFYKMYYQVTMMKVCNRIDK